MPRVCGERPCGGAAEQRDELAPSDVTCHAHLPRRHAESKILHRYSIIRVSCALAAIRLLSFDTRPISRVAVKVGRTVSSISFSWNAASYLSRPRPRSQLPTSIIAP